MKRRKTFKKLIIDILFFGLYSFIGFYLFLLYGVMGPEGDFARVNVFFRNFVLPALMLFQLLIGFGFNLYFYIKERTRNKIKINLSTFILNIIILITPYIVLIPEVIF